MKKLSSIDFNSLLLNNYKRLKISEKELVVLLLINNLLNNGNELITADLLSLKMNLSSDEIDEIMCSLVEKNYLTFASVDKDENKLQTSLENLNRILYRELTKTILGNEFIKSAEDNKKVEQLYEMFSLALKRNLAPLELAKIDDWLKEGYSCEEVSYALKKAQQDKKLTLRNIEINLRKSKISRDVDEEGYSFSTTNMSKQDIEEAIKIINTPWVKK
ncbi:MAG: DnaD domain protein [Firmicutes bacterium]|nr:DnaD domain protein [Candidatus Alectryobacillus merdavium]